MTFPHSTQWRTMLHKGEISSKDLIEESFNKINKYDPKLNALISHYYEESIHLARKSDKRIKDNDRGAMVGLPFALKDNFNWSGSHMTCGSKILKGYISNYNATVVNKLLNAGAIPIAKTNMDEFAMGSSGEFSAYGPTLNPWDNRRVSGGSSSGSVVSVSAQYVVSALGSDTGGSVRLPGSFCNVTAMRPTYGISSRYGLTSMASSLDVVGPCALSAFEVGALLSVIAGEDIQDSTSIKLPRCENLYPLRPLNLKGIRIGLPKEYFTEGIDPAVRQVIETSIREFENLGAVMVSVTLPHTSYAIDTYYLICVAEVSSNLARFDGIRFGHRTSKTSTLLNLIAKTRDEGLGEEAKRRILLGAFCLNQGHVDEYYYRALKARNLITRDFNEAFTNVDFLLTPVSPSVAFSLGAKSKDPAEMYLSDVYSAATSLSGLPCISVPGGFVRLPNSEYQLPVGIQLIAPIRSDVKLLELAHAFQLSNSYHLTQPKL
ncbi:MAG: Asp-tRNA(Asn)/Glu-tRNA(Gln) amidotransferase subunit GatA [Holophagaceae bacterium]